MYNCTNPEGEVLIIITLATLAMYIYGCQVAMFRRNGISAGGPYKELEGRMIFLPILSRLFQLSFYHPD